MSYDTIIIGAGLSGLAAGIRLAYFEKKVCILERHTTIGGLNSFYRLRGRNHDVGLHAVTNYAEPGAKGTPLSKIIRQLRLSWDDFNLSPQKESSVVFPGHTLGFTNNFEYFTQQVAEQFPDQKDNFQKLIQRINDYDELSLDRQELSGRAVVSECISDPLLVEMLFCPLMFYGSASAHDMDFGQFVIMFKSLFYEGFGRPYEGVRLLLKNLVKKFKSVGGELRLRSGVSSIRTENGRTTGVELDNGEFLEADNVLSSAGSLETFRMCEEGSEIAEQYEPGEISYVETIFSLDKQPTELGHDKTIIFYNDSEDFRYACPSEPVDVRSGIVCSPNNFAYDTPLDEGRIRITALANPDYWMNLPEEEYVAQKQVWCDRIVESALRYMPDFRDSIVDTDMFTPRTIKKYTGHLNGAVYGAPKKIIDGKTYLENLYLCGTDQGFLGIIGSMLSGISIANAYLLK